MTPAQVELYERGKERGIGAAVLSRIVRLNPNWDEATQPRGWHPAPSSRTMMLAAHNMVGKQHFIKVYGGSAAAWKAIPNGLKHKYGRREYLRREDVLDNIWKVWSGEIPPPPMGVDWYPTKKYANDKGLVVCHISAEEFLARRAAA